MLIEFVMDTITSNQLAVLYIYTHIVNIHNYCYKLVMWMKFITTVVMLKIIHWLQVRGAKRGGQRGSFALDPGYKGPINICNMCVLYMGPGFFFCSRPQVHSYLLATLV